MADLDGMVVVVTGATRGIGRSIARAIVQAGGRVTAAARSAPDVEHAAAELNGGSGERAIGVVCDVTRADDCAHLIDETVQRFGRIDGLINNAGVGRFANVGDMDLADWRAVIGTNLDGVFYCCRAAIPHMRRAGSGWIINIGSLAGKNAFPGGAAYNASKFGVIGFSEAMMQEVRHDGIRVSYIMPGSVATEFGGPTGATKDAWKIHPDDIADIVLGLLVTPSRTLPSRIEVRPSRPPKK